MISKITTRYGLEGLLAVARLGSESLQAQTESTLENSVHVPPNTVIDLLEKIEGEQ